jgi:hypothetical protein
MERDLMTETVKWGRAGLSWRDGGYVLEAPLWVDARAVYLCREELERTVADVLREAGFRSLTAIGWEPREDVAETPRLEIVTANLPSPEAAVRLRETVSAVLGAAAERSRRAAEDEEFLILAVLETIRGS